VVGIPGKIVKLREAGVPNPYGIDLDHHLIPDPVGKAIACLLERIDTLELKVAMQHSATSTAFVNGPPASCAPDNEICETDCRHGVQIA
jgi:serine O-acetyltransferase